MRPDACGRRVRRPPGLSPSPATAAWTSWTATCPARWPWCATPPPGAPPRSGPVPSRQVRKHPSSRPRRAATLRVAPLQVGALLAERLFRRQTVVLTSATLALGGSFEPLARQWGLPRPGAEPPGTEAAAAGTEAAAPGTEAGTED